jgi:hypothetical protein
VSPVIGLNAIGDQLCAPPPPGVTSVAAAP